MKSIALLILIFILPLFAFSQKEAKLFYYHFDQARSEVQSISEIEEELNLRLSSYEAQLLTLIEKKSNATTEYRTKESENLLSTNGREYLQRKISKIDDEIFAFENDIGMKLQSEVSEFQESISKYFSEKAKEFCEKKGIKIFLAYENIALYGYISVEYDRTEEFILFLNQEKNEFHSVQE